jgi:hypothetical protein
MKIDKENMEHVQEILDKYKVDGLNDLDRRLFEWGEENMKVFEVSIPKTVMFKIRVNAVNSNSAIQIAEDILDLSRTGPDAEHGSYKILGPSGKAFTTSTREVRDA